MSMDYNLPGGHVTQAHPQRAMRHAKRQVLLGRWMCGSQNNGGDTTSDLQQYCVAEWLCAPWDGTGVEAVQALRCQR